MWHIETIFFAIVLAPIAVLGILHVIVWARRILTELPWESAPGILEEAALQHDEDGAPFISVRYKFHIDGQPYWGSQEIRVSKSVSPRNLRELCPIGHGISVEYHPDDPENHSTLNESDRKQIASA